MKYTLLPLLAFILFLSGCGNSSSENISTVNSSPYTGEAFISSLPSDTTPVTNLAVAPYVPSSLPLLVVLLEYDNQTIVSSDSTWAQKIFGYNDQELNSYFKEISNDQFHFTPANETYGTQNDGIIKVHLSKNHIDTDINDPNFYTNLAQDLQSALTATDSHIDFSVYDSDADGAIQPTELTLVFVIAGYEDAYAGGHITNGIWAHQSSLQSADAPTLDGVSLCNAAKGGKYAVFGERHKDTDSAHDATVGVIAHELGHAVFALPDLYNINGGAGGIGIFGLMGAGAWTRKSGSENYGDTPVHMSAWSKSFIGWVTSQEFQNTSTILNETTSSSYNVIKIPISANHYYLLENRNDSGYDRGLRQLEGTFQGGILIWHIDNTKLTTDNFASNTVNADPNDKGVDVVEANDPILDSVANASGKVQALFFDPNRTEFGSKVTNISSPGSVMNLTIH